MATTTYTVKSGDNLGSIAQKFGMTLAQIQSLNNISDPNKLQIGQKLKVYSTSGGSTGGDSTRATTTYTVKSGDNLGSIAQKFGMTLAQIQSLNNITDPNKLQIGQKLKVYSSSGGSTGGGSTRPTSTYTVKSGDNLGSIAQKFGMTLAQIQSLNNITDPNKLQIGQNLKVYSTSGGSTGGGSTRPTTTYTVRSGDNLGSIAQKYGMTLAQIQSLNNISDPNKLQIGQKLKVYASSGGSTGGSTRPTTTYTVKSGDNLGSIAQKYGMTVAQIQSLNNISDPNKLQIGQKLKVYSSSGGSESGGSSRKTITYTIKSGDNLGSIALRYDMTVAQIQSLNNISDPNKIQIGQRIKVYDNGSSNDGGKDTPTQKTTTYIVVSGDNLSSIAQRFGMTLSQIQSLNGISDPNKLQVGQKLKVYDNGSGSDTGKDTSTPIKGGTGKTGKYVSESQLNHIGWPSSKISDAMLKDLNSCLERYHITTRSRITHFLAQCSQESACGVYRTELASGWDYEYNTSKGVKLGNTQPGDGPKYKGGGYIQLTGRYNYTAFSKAIGDPEIVNQGVNYVASHYPWTSAGFWWHNNNMNALCDTNPTVRAVTLRVNGGTNHLANREMYYAKAIQVF
ncbi:Predicted chitinase [Terribacillus aidingensis]|uniref:Predicted chitinase n=1 Tax=Terribacillus aidingensis TaxID=586416 RepID=A0A285NL61_9BACI|nr:LysM peptidoglycan-binding domain-containing protein [Terribacillus aidingensis]SNZ09968.1 Predicted chitinase [Terribacillus aidingensis]